MMIAGSLVGIKGDWTSSQKHMKSVATSLDGWVESSGLQAMFYQMPSLGVQKQERNIYLRYPCEFLRWIWLATKEIKMSNKTFYMSQQHPSCILGVN